MTKCLSPDVFAILLPQIHHLFVLPIYFLFSVLYHNIRYQLLYPSSHVSCGGEVFSCPLSSLKWFQSCVAMKFRPVSPDVVRSQLAMFFALSGVSSISLMSASHCTSPVGQTVPYFPKELCLSIIPQSLLATLVKSSHVHRKSCPCLLHHVLPLAEPSDVLCGTTHCFIGQYTSRCSRRSCRQAFPQILKPSHPRALPAFFFLSHHQPSTSFQIWRDLLESSHPQGINCFLRFKHPFLSASVSTPNQRCALRRAPLKFCRADALSSLARYGGHPSGGLRLLAGVPALLQAGVSPLSSSQLEGPPYTLPNHILTASL